MSQIANGNQRDSQERRASHSYEIRFCYTLPFRLTSLVIRFSIINIPFSCLLQLDQPLLFSAKNLHTYSIYNWNSTRKLKHQFCHFCVRWSSKNGQKSCSSRSFTSQQEPDVKPHWLIFFMLRYTIHISFHSKLHNPHKIASLFKGVHFSQKKLIYSLIS